MRRIALTARLAGAARVPHFRPRVGLILAILVALMVLLGGALYTMVFAPRPAPVEQAPASIAIPDTLLATKFEQGPMTMSLWAYLSGSNAFQPVLDGAGHPVIAPDGRQLAAGRVTRDGDTVHVAVVALDSATLARQWEAEVATFPASALAQGNLTSAGASVAITANRVYASLSVWGSLDPLAIVALDRTSGHEVARWSIATDGTNASGGALIYASPDGSSLYLLDSTFDPTTHQTNGTVYLRISTADGRVEDRRVLTSPDGQPFYPGDRIAPDGRTLYSVGGYVPGTDALAIQFFDLGSGTVLPSLDLPLQRNGEFLDHEEASSADGGTLYVLAPTSGELAIVDLQSRAVTQVVPVEDLTAAGPSLVARIFRALRGLIVQQAAAKFYFSGDMQLSPDGKRLYAVGVSGSGYEAIPTGIVAIDTTTWRVTDRWLPDAQVNFVQLGGDGRTLYVQTSDGSGQLSLTALDTTTGVSSPAADDLPGYVFSLSQLYHERYGKSFGAAGGVAATSAPVVPVARLDISVDRTSILSGDRVTVDARFVDPGTDQVVTPGQDGVRFEPPAQMTATFYHGQLGPDDVTVDLRQVSYGHYRGSAVLNEPKVWSLQVDATREKAPGSRAHIASAVAVQAAFAGTDGRRYMLELTTDPAMPVRGRETTVRVAFVDAERGTPLPDGVDLAGGTPESIDAAFFLGLGNLGQAQEMISTTLSPTGHGSYTGSLSLDKTSGWAVQIDFLQNGQTVYTLAGTVQVATP